MRSLKSKNLRNNKSKSYRVKVLSDNLVDKDVQSMLFPLNLMQNIFLCPKYSIRGNFISQNSSLSNFASLCGTVALIALYFYRIYKFYSDNDIRTYVNFMYISSYFDFGLFCIGFIMNYIVGVIKTKRNIMFLLKIQDIHRFLNEKDNSRRFIVGNWIIIISVLVFYFSITTYISITLNLPVYMYLCIYVLICFDGNIVYAIRLIQLLKDKVVLWNTQALRFSRTEDTNMKFYYKRLFQAYASILECYDIYKNSFQHMVSTIYSLANN